MTEEANVRSPRFQRPNIQDIAATKQKREKTFEDKLLHKLHQEYIEAYGEEAAEERESVTDPQPERAVRDENRTQYEDRLLDKLMAHIEVGYQEQEKRRRQVRSETLMITSAVPLTDEEKEQITRKFIELSKVMLRRITTVVDPRLITGVRLQSETFYYEVSGQKKLREIRAFLEKGWLQGDES